LSLRRRNEQQNKKIVFFLPFNFSQKFVFAVCLLGRAAVSAG
jgi:hypothetical protein